MIIPTLVHIFYAAVFARMISPYNGNCANAASNQVWHSLIHALLEAHGMMHAAVARVS
jgi:hypothetical protein